MVFSIEVQFRWIAEAMTLEPGDVVTTGTPAGVGPLVAGDVVEVRIANVGNSLSNPVVGPKRLKGKKAWGLSPTKEPDNADGL